MKVLREFGSDEPIVAMCIHNGLLIIATSKSVYVEKVTSEGRQMEPIVFVIPDEK